MGIRSSSDPSKHSHKSNEEIKKFKFDKRWLDNEELRQVILEGWKSPDLFPDTNIMEHISSCRKAFKPVEERTQFELRKTCGGN